MQHMDVSETDIVFVYGGDIGLVPIEGSTAVQVTSSPGEESCFTGWTGDRIHCQL